MQKFFQSGNLFLAASMIFLIAAVFAEQPAAFIVLGVAFFILSLNARKKNAAKGTGYSSKV